MDTSAEHAKSGPANPADGLDRPTPPGGPQRVDAPETDTRPDGAPASAEPDSSETEETEETATPGGQAGAAAPAGDTDPAPRDVVEENAETSLDQPSGDVS